MARRCAQYNLLNLSLYVGPEGDCAPGDQVTCGQCGQRFPLADLSAFVQHKMAAACARPEEGTRRARPEEETRRARPEEEEARTAARASLSSPRVSGTDEVVALHKDEQEQEEEDRRRGGGGSPDLEDSSTAGLYHTDRAAHYCWSLDVFWKTMTQTVPLVVCNI